MVRRATRETLAQPTNSRVVTLDEALNGEIRNSEVISTLPYAQDKITPHDEYDEDDSDVERICAELGEDINRAFIKVYEVSNDVNVPEADCFRCDASEWDTIIERIRRDFIDRTTGEGTYHLKGFKPQIDPDTGERLKRVCLFMNRFIRVKVSKTWLSEQARKLEMGTSNDLLERRMDDNQKMMMQGMKDMQASFMQAIQTLTPKQESRLDMLKEMELMKSMFAAPVREERDPLEVVEKMLAIKGKIELATGGGEQSYLPYIVEMAKPMIEGLKQQQAAQPATQPVAQPEPQAGGVDMNNIAIKMMLTSVLKAATNDADPYAYANLILDNAPDEVVEQILTAPNWFEQLCVIEPKAAHYKTWFINVRQEMVNLTTDEQPDNATPTETSIPTNVPNAKT